MTANWLSYLVLTIAHILNHDFGKQTYIAVNPSTVDDAKRPYYLWGIAMGLYEFSLTTSLSVFVVYCAMEWPFQHVFGLWDVLPWYFEVLGLLIHAVP